MSEPDASADIASKTLLSFLSATPPVPIWNVNNLPEGGNGKYFSAQSSTRVYDMQDRPVFDMYSRPWTGGLEALVRVSCDKRLGSPVISIGINPPLDVAGAIEQAESFANANSLQIPQSAKGKIICYSYPKLGIRATTKTGTSVILDIFEHSIIPTTPNVGLRESTRSWSLLDVAKRYKPTESARLYKNNLIAIEKIRPELAALKQNAPQDDKQNLVNGLTLYPQAQEEWCAAAVGEMILGFYGVAKSQKDIAQAMNVGPDGATDPDQVTAYSTLSGDELTASLDPTANLSTAQQELDADRPVKNAIPGHARAVAGWMNKAAAKATSDSPWIYVYDPWPPDKGHIYWESWDAIPHVNFIYVRKTNAEPVGAP